MVTSNHIHLLVVDGGGRDVIPKSIKLVAGRTGQEYNQRKNRNGAFWEDRYHATAVSSDRHLIQCIAYIDLNMVRTGLVNHPSEWNFGGYEEILKTKNYVRESKWSQSIAVGSKSFVEGIKEKLGIRAKGRKVGESGGLYHLREAQVPYNSDFTPENSELRARNTYFWCDNP
jgi:REP-associated tyrosine transposase